MKSEILQSIIDHLPDLVYVCDLHGNLIVTNRAFENLDQSQEGCSTAARILRDLSTHDIEVRDKKRSLESEYSLGPELNLRCVKFPLFKAGQVHAIGTILSNVSSILRANREIELERQRCLHAEKMASLGEMAAGIAHEISNPLSIINCRATQIREILKQVDPEIDEGLRHTSEIERTCTRINKIIKGLSSFAHTWNDDFELVDVSALLEETLQFCGDRFKLNEVNLKVCIASALPRIECRRVQVQQVLINLLNNAFDAAIQSCERWVEISIDPVDQFGGILISVSDSGKGVDEALREKIMEPFFTTKSDGAGLGLGLSISRQICTAHRGSLEYNPNAPHTQFVVRLPVNCCNT